MNNFISTIILQNPWITNKTKKILGNEFNEEKIFRVIKLPTKQGIISDYFIVINQNLLREVNVEANKTSINPWWFLNLNAEARYNLVIYKNKAFNDTDIFLTGEEIISRFKIVSPKKLSEPVKKIYTPDDIEYYKK